MINYKLQIILLLISSFILYNLAFIIPTQALYQPWIAEQAARKAYNEKKATYNAADQKKLDGLAAQIVEINKKRTDELTVQTEAQGEILDEYQSRTAKQSNDQIDESHPTGQSGSLLQQKLDKARYWLTFAHEAVAFQAAKNYIFNLTTESNLKADVTPTVNGFENDLAVLRKKVINSQQIIQELVKE